MANKKRELIPTIQTAYGPVVEGEDFYTAGPGGDVTYVPGYSDLRKERDLAIADRKKPLTLPVRLQWARNARVSGEPDSTKQWEYQSLKYRPVTKDDLGEAWFTAMPPAGSVAPDGSIRMQDMTLMVCDAQTAAQNAARVQRATERQTASIGGKLLSQGDRVKGSDPTVESTRAEKALGQE